MRLTDGDDLKYVYAAHRLGGTPLETLTSTDPESFAEEFAEHVAVRYHRAYTMIATPPGKENMPVGIVFTILPFYEKPVMWIGDFIWFPWASSRNRLEATVHFLNQMRRDTTLLGFAEPEVINFFEHVCRYGVARRAGTVFDMLREGPMAVFQTRKPYMGGK